MTWNKGEGLLLLLVVTWLESFESSMFSMSIMRGPEDNSASSDSVMPPTGENNAFSCCAAVEAVYQGSHHDTQGMRAKELKSPIVA